MKDDYYINHNNLNNYFHVYNFDYNHNNYFHFYNFYFNHDYNNYCNNDDDIDDNNGYFASAILPLHRAIAWYLGYGLRQHYSKSN